MAEQRRLIAFRFYVDDFIGGTNHFTDEEIGCYLRLLIHQFMHGGIDEKRISRIADSGAKNWPEIKSKFEKCDDGLFRNERMSKSRADALYFSEQQSLRAKKRTLDGKADGLPTGMPDGSGSGRGSGIMVDKKGGAGGKQQLMRNSPYFDLEKLISDIDPKYHIYDLAHYHESALSWSDAGQKKKADWLATIRSWILKDIKANTPKLNKDDYRNQKVGRITVGAMQDFASRRSFAVDEPPGS